MALNFAHRQRSAQSGDLNCYAVCCIRKFLQVLAIEFVLLAIDFVPLANEFVPLAIEFVALAFEFIAFVFVRNKIGSWSEHENKM